MPVVSEPPARPLMIFDGDCRFCRLWIARWRQTTRGEVDYAASQEAAAMYPEIPAEAFRRSVQLVMPDGRVLSGAQAAFTARALGGRPSALWAYDKLTGFAPACEAGYRFVAGHRTIFSWLTRALWGVHVERPGFRIAHAVFLRLLGLIYLIAFASLWVQIDALAGSQGVLPVGHYLDAARAQLGPQRYWMLPTLCWLSASDWMLHALCGGGVLFSILLALGLLPALSAAVAWLLYLSLVVVCRLFTNFQWDALLLETGLLAILLAPLTLRSRVAGAPGPPRAVVWLLRWLLFRLMFASGVMKLASGDHTWWDLTALTSHYETQPLPHWVSWYAHQLPVWFHKMSCAVMFLVELGAPWLIAAPRRLRLGACAALLGLQALILATGNYGFFNLGAMLLCLLVVDDWVWPERWRTAPEGSGRRLPRLVLAPAAVVIAVLGLMELTWSFRMRIEWPAPLELARVWLSPLRSVNTYGLFADMTTERPEIIIEGSDDGERWLAYEFKWKPGDPAARPRLLVGHMPRLDWQMWFAALGGPRSSPWLALFMRRIQEGSPPVLAQLGRNPFPHHPPRHIRALIYRYHFTDASQRRDSAAWWRRELQGIVTNSSSQNR